MIKVEQLKIVYPQAGCGWVSFAVEQGEVLDFSSQRAGKSTTMRMITGFIPPTEGRGDGGRTTREQPIAAKRLIGYLPENAPAHGHDGAGIL